MDAKTRAWTRKENPSARSFCFSMISLFLILHILKDRWWQQQKAFISAEVLGNKSQKICFPKEDQMKQSQVCAHSSGEQFLQEEVSKPTLLPMALSWGLKNQQLHPTLTSRVRTGSEASLETAARAAEL